MAEVRRWAQFVGWPLGAPLAAIFGAGVVGAFYRSNRTDKTIAGVVVLYAILLTCTTGANLSISARYLAPCLPFLCALIVRLVERLWRHEPHRGRRSLTRVVVGLSIAGAYAAFCIGGISLFFYRLHTADFTSTLQRIASSTGPNGRVYGRTLLWMGRDLYHYGPFYRYDPHLRERSIELVRQGGFDYVVRFAWSFDSSGGVSRPPQSMPPFREDAIDQLCEQYGVKLDEFHDPNFGPIEVYRLEWARDGRESGDPP